MSSLGMVGGGLYRFGAVRRMARWLDALPHPAVVCEVAATHVAAARWGRGRWNLEGFAVEPLPAGTLAPSPIETNVVSPEVVRGALRKVFSRIPAEGQELALLIPDPVVRVFILPFDTFPRKPEEGLPLLRWRLKKSVPFDVDETVVSSMRQDGRNGSLEIVAALARQRIVREYESLVESVGSSPGVVLSSTLAVLPMLESDGPTLLARMSGTNLTTVIVHGGALCVYRSTEMPVGPSQLEQQALLDEMFPAVAYYQDTWGGSVERVRLAGMAERLEVFRRAVGNEMGCAVMPLAVSDGDGKVPTAVESLMEHDLDALVGWTMNRGA